MYGINTRGLPGTFEPMYQELASGYSVAVAHLVVVLDPEVLGLLRRLDGGFVVLSHAHGAVRHPVDVLLDRDHHVGEHRRAGRPGDGEQVREAVHHESEVGARAVLPLLLQGEPVLPLDVDRHQRTGHGVEPGGEYDGVELELFVARADAVGVISTERRPAQVDEPDVVPVVRLVVAGVEARALGAERVVERAEVLCRLRVVHDRADALADVLAGGVVGFFVGQQVVEGQQHADEVPGLPPHLVHGVALLGRLQRRLRRLLGGNAEPRYPRRRAMGG